MTNTIKETLARSFVAISMAAVLTACGPTPEQIAEQVKDSMQQTLRTDANFSNYDLQVTKVMVVKESGNRYQGMATVRYKDVEKDVPVVVTAGEGKVMWKTDNGAFLFVVQRDLKSVFGQ